MVNHLIEKEQTSRIRSIVIDELHLIGDESRGFMLELLLTKLKYMREQCYGNKIQVVSMSATFPNLSQVSKWLQAQLFVTDFRPVKIREYVQTIGSR